MYANSRASHSAWLRGRRSASGSLPRRMRGYFYVTPDEAILKYVGLSGGSNCADVERPLGNLAAALTSSSSSCISYRAELLRVAK